MAVVEFARNVCGLCANSTEIDKNCSYPVINILEEQKKVMDKGGTMRLGDYPSIIRANSLVQELYGCQEVYERHRHRYEVNPKYQEILENKGLILSENPPIKLLLNLLNYQKKNIPTLSQHRRILS